MKKILSLLLAISMTTTLATVPTYAKEKEHGYLYDLIYSQNQGFVKTKDDSLKVTWDKTNNIPRFISGNLSKSKVNNSTDALKYLKENMDAFKLNHGDFTLISEKKDSLGYSHYRFLYVVDGLNVLGNEIFVHTNADKFVYSVNGQLNSSIPKNQYNKDVKLTATDAVKNAEKNIGKTFTQGKKDLFLSNVNNHWTPVYNLKLWNDDEISTWVAVVNATTGNIIKAHEENYNEIAPATGIGIRGDTKDLVVEKRNNMYYLENLSNSGKVSTYDAKNGKTLPGTLVSSSTNVFNTTAQAAAVDAHHYVDKVFKYYKNTFNRAGLDGKGSAFQVTVHYGRNYLNAYFNGRNGLVFGDGDNTYAKDFSKAYDIIAHECTHAVTENSAALAYENQSGALNESFSDVLAILMENRDWTIGEDIVLPNAPIKLMRSLEDPTLYDQPANMKDYKNLPNTQDGDWGGVHTNSGIPNKAFYNIVQLIGKEKAGQIYYRALTNYLHSQSNFQDARDSLESSAKDLYGSAEKLAISKGFYAVGIGDEPQDSTLTLKAANVSVDNPTNTGNFTLSMGLDGQNTAKTIKVIENGTTEVLNQAVNVETTGKTLTKAFTNKAEGKYIYVVEVSDGTNTKTSQVEVTVTKANPLTLKTPKISVDNATNTGSYTLTVALDGQNSAKTVKVIENGKTEVLNQAVNVETAAKTLTKAFTNKAEGKYVYVVEVSDGTTSLTSQIEITVTKAPTAPAWKAHKYYYTGDVVLFNGVTYKCIRSHYSLSRDNLATLSYYWKKA